MGGKLRRLDESQEILALPHLCFYWPAISWMGSKVHWRQQEVLEYDVWCVHDVSLSVSFNGIPFLFDMYELVHFGDAIVLV